MNDHGINDVSTNAHNRKKREYLLSTNLIFHTPQTDFQNFLKTMKMLWGSDAHFTIRKCLSQLDKNIVSTENNSLTCIRFRAEFLNRGMVDILNSNIQLGRLVAGEGLFCALYNCQSHSWLLFARCQQQFLVIKKKCLQTLPNIPLKSKLLGFKTTTLEK